MKSILRLTLIAAVSAAGLCLRGGSAIFDPAASAANWSFNPGAEFPGASGETAVDPAAGKVTIRAEFAEDSRYAAGVYKPELPPGIEKLRFRVVPDRELEAQIRVVDASDRSFQTARTRLAADTHGTLTLDLANGEWPEKWGGKEPSAAAPLLPLKEILLIVNRGPDRSAALRIDAVEAEAPFINGKPFRGEAFRFSAFGCDISGNWTNGTNPKLKLAVTAAGTVRPGTRLAVAFPDMFRDKVVRYEVKPGESAEYEYAPPLVLGGNAFNTYRIGITLEQDGRTVAGGATLLRGADSPDWSRRLTSAEVRQSIIGCGVHFNFAPQPAGDFAVWHDYERIMKLLSEAGIKYIRDDFQPRRPDGTPGAAPGQLARLKAAKKHGFRVIAIIPTMADQTLDSFLEDVRGLVSDTRDDVAVYEIGNEPHNFGGWIPRFGGTWNARQPDNSTSPWLLEHAKYAKAAADLIHELAPQAEIIGGGCVTAANIRYLQSGVSEHLDGIADHPYANMLPPERLMFGTPFEGRDGVKAGGSELTLPEVVAAYREQFETMNRRDLSLYFTEFGYTTYVYDGRREREQYGFAAYTEEAQAAYIARRFLQCFTLPAVKAVLQYDGVDDFGGKPFDPEANFGLLRADLSPKAAYFAVQNLATLFDGVRYRPELDRLLKIEEQPLQRAAKREHLLDWEGNGRVLLKADNSLHAHLFATNGGLRLAVWSGQQYSGEFANRTAEIRVRGKAGSAGRTVGTDLVSGKCFDVPSRPDGGDLLLTLSVGNNPLAVTFF